MSISLCRRISMALVVCICASFCLLPFRAAAGQAEINNLAQPVLAQWRRLNSILPTDKEHAAQVLKTLFIQYDVDASFSSVAVEDLEGVAKTFSQIGISAVFKEVALPSGGYGWVLQCDSIESFPVNIYGLYAPGGRIIYSPTEEEDDSAATSSRPSYTAPSTNVDIEYTQVFDSTTNTWVDVEINKYDQSVTNNTINNNHYWDVDNRQFWDVENNTYTTYNDITYNPSTQTYNVQFSDNRTYTYQFYYDYTYVTYIGSSAEYREAYKVYYELPDGRSSGDLTVDELKGLSLQFDMVNYDTVASDTLTQALFPFDGDVENIAYYPNEFQWVANASTSYLESPDGFGGNLYLDLSSPTRFNIRNTSTENEGIGFRVAESGFTTQMRLYLQSGYSAFAICLDGFGQIAWWNEDDSSILEWHRQWSLWNLCSFFGGNIVFRNFWGNYVASDSSTIVNIPHPIGEWFDFTIVYVPPLNGFETISVNDYLSSPGRYYIYLNGLLVFSYTCKPSSQTNLSLYRYLNSYLSMSWAGSTTQTNHAPNLSYFGGLAFYCPNGEGSDAQLDNFRIVRTALYNGADFFTPTPVPFQTNLVYVLPSVVDLNDNTVAIMSQLPVSGYRVGGIRPTDPTLASGYIYMHIDGDFVDSVQQWNGSYWEEVTARLYTGVRWIPVTAFNVFTLEDMFDIVDPDGDGGGESVSTIYQYYLWWSGEWGTFQQWLQGTMETLIEAIQNSGSGGSGGPVTIVPGYNDQTTTNEITTENPDGSTTVTTIVSNAAGLVYSRSVTTWPPDAEGNVSSIEIYTDSSGVSFRTEIQVDKEGDVTIIDPSEATGTLGGFLTMIAQGVMSIATSVIQAFVDLLVEVVEFVLDSVSLIFAGIVNILASLLSALAGFGAQIGTAAEFIGAFYSILPAPIQAGFTLLFVGGVSVGLFRLIHF